MSTKKLTEKEIQVIELLAKGYTANQIAKKLKKSKRTVDCQIFSARKRLRAKNSIHLFAKYINYK